MRPRRPVRTSRTAQKAAGQTELAKFLLHVLGLAPGNAAAHYNLAVLSRVPSPESRVPSPLEPNMPPAPPTCAPGWTRSMDDADLRAE